MYCCTYANPSNNRKRGKRGGGADRDQSKRPRACGPFYPSRRTLLEPDVDDDISKRWVWHGTPSRLSVNDSHGTGGRNSARSAVSASVRSGSNNGKAATTRGVCRWNHDVARAHGHTRALRPYNRRPCNPPRQSSGWPAVGRSAGDPALGRRGWLAEAATAATTKRFPPSPANAPLLNVGLLRTGCC
jgi:hypothetical protein